MADNEATLKLRADIKELKSEFQQAQRIVKVANSEFQAATAGMDNWAQSADGLQSKINQLTTVLGAEETKLKTLEDQYDKTVELMGKNSKGAQELEVKLNYQRATVARVSAELNGYQTALDNVGKESNDIVSVIDKQEKELGELKNQYTKLVVEQKQGTNEAKDLEAQISKLSSELRENKKTLANATKEADKFDESLDDSEEAAKKAKETMTAYKVALGNLIADGIKAAVNALIDLGKELGNVEGVYKNFQAQVGATTEEMSEFKEEMNDIYKSGIGESLEDIGDKMAYVKQVTGEVDPSKIGELTEKAIILEETFGSDFNETIRGVTNLMTHFGIDSEEAFDLFAKGSQEGLDYTDELGDNIAEYGGNFAQAGYSAEEYFQLLKNGSKSGAYNLDKVNDSINEVKNRLGDGTIEKNITLFSKETQNTFKQWKNGKKTMKNVIDSIVKDINECTDEQDALTMAAEAFGTMGEDANLAVVKSLTSVGDEFDNVSGKMEEIKDIKYDDVATELKTLGRTVQTDILLPLIQEAMPKIKEGVTWVKDNLDTLVPIITGVGIAIAAAFVINKVALFAQSIVSLIEIVKKMTVATKAHTAAQTALNATNPFGWVAIAITAILALIPIISNLLGKSDDLTNKYSELSSEEQALIDKTNELTRAYESWNDAKSKAMSNVSAEFSYYDELKNELSEIVDGNGKIKKGYEDRAAVITGILSDALGIEIQITDGVIQKYGELKQSIDDVIVSKKADAMLTALENDYTVAIQNKSAALQQYVENQKAFQATTEEINTAKAHLNRLIEDGIVGYAGETGMLVESTDTHRAYEKALEDARNKVKGLSAQQSEQRDAMWESEEAYVGYIQTIENYEGVSAAVISGDTEKITDSLLLLEKGFVTAETGTKRSLEAQTENYKAELKNLKQAIKDKTPGVTQEQVDQMEELVEKSEAELEKLTPKAEKQGENAGEAFGDGIDGEKNNVKKDAEKVAEKAEDGLESADAEGTGEDFVDGFSKGMKNKEDGLWTKAWNLGKKAVNAIKAATDTNSPSEEAIAVGEFFADGLGIGIENGSQDVINTVAGLANEMLGAMETDYIWEDLLDATEEYLDDRYDEIKKSLDKELDAFKKTQEKELEALEKTQEKESTALEEAREKDMSQFERNHEKKLKLLDKEYMEKLKVVDEETYQKIKAIEDEIDGINATTEAEEKALKEEEQRKKRAKLQEEIDNAETVEERKAAEEELAEYEKELAREKVLEERELRKEELEKQKEEINEKAEAERDALEDEYNAKVQFENDGYEATKEILEHQWDNQKAALDEKHKLETENLEAEHDQAIEYLQERHETYLENVKKELDAELESLRRQKEEALKMIDELNQSKAFEIGESIVEGMKQGLESGTSAAYGAAWNLGASMITALKESTDTHSPSRAAKKIGNFFSQGLALGISDGEDGIIKTIKSVAADISETLTDELDFGTDLLAPVTADVGKLTTKDFASNAVAGETKNVTNVTNFYQTNNSPKALSRTEIYRQTKNQLAFAGGGK